MGQRDGFFSAEHHGVESASLPRALAPLLIALWMALAVGALWIS
jgi:hypothetical protein